MSEDEAIAQGYTVIKTAQDLDNIRNNLSGKYILMGDIDLSGYDNWEPIGEYNQQTGESNRFKGTFDGNGYVIKNLTINRPTERCVGLFRNTESSTLKNIGLENIDVKGEEDTGGLVGLNSAGSTVSNCYATGNVSGTNYKIGGLVGLNSAGSTVSNCYATGNVTGNSITGGLVGANSGTVQNSYATGNVTGNSITGGLVGFNGMGTVANCIWDQDTTGCKSAVAMNERGTEINNKGLTSDEMKNPANWAGWDDTVWDLSSGAVYPPKLKWQTQSQKPVDPTGPDAPSVTPEGSIRLQVGYDEKNTSVIYLDTRFDLDAFMVDFSTADGCTQAIDDIDALLAQINEKRSDFGAVLNRLNSILQSQTTTTENFTAAKSTVMDADIAEESANYVKNQILQQTSSALLTQAQDTHASLVLSLLQ